MQIHKKQLARQQAILKHLGFYHGAIDGIWSTSAIEAKRNFENDTSFNPGVPSNGLPFPGVGPYPKGITKDTANKQLLTAVGLDIKESEASVSPDLKTDIVDATEKKDPLEAEVVSPDLLGQQPSVDTGSSKKDKHKQKHKQKR